ncbi:MAG: ABC transporter permease [Ilumatobacteraceae bacterium]
MAVRPTAAPTHRAWARPQGLRTAAVVVVLIAAWELLARTVFAGSYVLSSPSAIVEQFLDQRGLYLRNLAYTAGNAAWGFVWGNLAAVALAVISTLVAPVKRTISGISVTIFCLPLVALAPILRSVFGAGDTTAIALAALAVFFTTFVAARLGFDAAPGGALEVVRSYGRGPVIGFSVVRARASVPALFAGLQVAAPAAFLGALVGEFAGAERGFGILTIQALRTLEPDRVWTVAAISTVVSCGAYVVIGAIGRLLCPWAATVDVSTASMRRPRRRWPWRVVGVLVSVAAVLGLWVGFLRAFDVDPYFAKTPADVWSELVTGPDSATMRDVVLPALWSTLGTTAIGFVAGLAFAVALAVLFTLLPWLERGALPVAVALRAVPIIATVPVIILVVGRGVLTTVVIVAIMSFFPTLVNCTAAMRRTPTGILDVLRAYDATPLARTTVAYLPNAVPALLASARIAVPTSLLGATVAEWLATGNGIGNLMTVAANTARYDVLWVCVAVLTLAAVIGYAAVSAGEAAVLGRIAPERAP